MAKGRLLGTQFYALFEGDLYMELGRHANRLAEKMADALQQCGYSFAIAPVSNQLFPFSLFLIHALAKDFGFYIWEQRNEQEAVVRLVTSWATAEEHIDLFIERLRELSTQEFVILVDENDQAIGSMENWKRMLKTLNIGPFLFFFLMERAILSYSNVLPENTTARGCGRMLVAAPSPRRKHPSSSPATYLRRIRYPSVYRGSVHPLLCGGAGQQPVGK